MSIREEVKDSKPTTRSLDLLNNLMKDIMLQIIEEANDANIIFSKNHLLSSKHIITAVKLLGSGQIIDNMVTEIKAQVETYKQEKEEKRRGNSMI